MLQQCSWFLWVEQLDFDGIEDGSTADDLKQWVGEQEETVCAYKSPSGGVKALIRTVKAQTKTQYVRLHNAVSEKYEETGYLDSATKNAVLPLFLSMDEKIIYRDFFDCKQWSVEKTLEIDHDSLNDTPKFNPNFNYSIYKQEYDRTIRILQEKISRIHNCGHPQVRSAALVLGSRVGAGYLSKADAEIEISRLIRSNNYLKKGTEGYIKTAKWGIEQGSNNPKYY